MRDTTVVVDTANTILEHNMLREHPGWVACIAGAILLAVLFVRRATRDSTGPRT